MKTSEGPLRHVFGTTQGMLAACMSVALCIGLASSSYAEDAPDKSADEQRSAEKELDQRYKDLAAEWKSVKRKKNITAMSATLKKATALYGDAEAYDDLRVKVLKFVGVAAKGTKGDTVRTMVLHTLADIGDLRGAKYIKPYLRQANPKKAPPLLGTAIATAMEVPDPSLVGPLLKIVTVSKTTGVIEEAIQALGKFKNARKRRGKILTTLVSEAKKVKPGARPRMRGGQENIDGGAGGGTTSYGNQSGSGARWAALSAAVPAALSELTGQDIGSMDDWIDLVKRNRGKLSNLFTAE